MRLLALFAVLSAAAAQTLDVTPGQGGMVDAWLTSIARQCWTARAAQVASLRTPAQVKERQVYIRSKLLEEIGGLPERTPLHPRITGKIERDGYRVEKLIFESQPRFFVTANVYVPSAGRPPYAAVLGTAGHSLDGKAAEVYQRAWIGLAKRGFLVLAYDPPGQGERFEYLDPATGKSQLPGGGTGEHTMAGVQCLLTGTNIARYMIWDGMRAFDYLLTRPDVDPRRIAVAGNSGGGTQAAYLAALEPRLAAAVPSCYITSWEKLWAGPGPQDAEQDFVNFLKDGLDFPDLLIAFLPRPILVAAAVKDFFPIDGARAAYAEAHSVAEVLSRPAAAGFFEFDDTHGWSRPRREATYRWLEKWLHGRNDSGAEPAFDVMAPPALQCTDTGQVATSLKSETLQSLNQALAESIYPQRAAARGKDVRELVALRLGVPETRGVPPWDKRGEIAREGYRIEKIEMQPEPGILTSALLFVPAGAGSRNPAVMWIDPAGKASAAAPGGPLEALVHAGNVVMAVDPRGYGESAPPAGAAMRALLVGRNLPGMRTGDLLRAFDLLAARHEVDARRIAVIGRGNGGVLALYLATLEPRIARVACERAPVSYMELVRAKMHGDILDIAVPGVLRDFDLPDLERALAPRVVWRAVAEQPDYTGWLK